MKISNLAENLIGSEILKISGEINKKISNGENIYNLTIGDFDPKEFPIPSKYTYEIIKAYTEGLTNYPSSEGLPSLRQAISNHLKRLGNLDYSPDEILVAGGARPIIYTIYKTILDPMDKVIFPVPSWNNNHYSYLSSTNACIVETKSDENFQPDINDIKLHITNATMIALCTPSNPTGMNLTNVNEICDLVVMENNRREPLGLKPLYIMYDQIYWLLDQHPYQALPDCVRPYTIYVDGMSKGFAATGVRVGWTFGSKAIIDKMKGILGHIGAWAARPEQVATGEFLNDTDAVDEYLIEIKNKINLRFQMLYDGLSIIPGVNVIRPDGAIYMSISFDLLGKKKPTGGYINNAEDITNLLLDYGIVLVPFTAFGSKALWWRLSVGTLKISDIPNIIKCIKNLMA